MAQDRLSFMVTFGYEPLDHLLKTGLSDLCLECWDKMDDGFYRDIFSPDWQLYKEQEENQHLGFFAMREAEKLIGYAVIVTNADIHQKDLKIAVLHDIYITEPKRGYATLFFHKIEQFALQLGCYRLDVAERLSVDADRGGIGKFYTFMGFKPMEVIWAKVLQQEGTA